MTHSPYIPHQPRPGEDGRCLDCGQMVTEAERHKTDPRVRNGRTRYACGNATGRPGYPCQNCGRPLLDTLPLRHRSGRVPGKSPKALPGTAAWRADQLAAGRRKAKSLLNPRKGYCECGTPLSKHPPLPPVGGLTSPGWPSRGQKQW